MKERMREEEVNGMRKGRGGEDSTKKGRQGENNW